MNRIHKHLTSYFRHNQIKAEVVKGNYKKQVEFVIKRTCKLAHRGHYFEDFDDFMVTVEHTSKFRYSDGYFLDKEGHTVKLKKKYRDRIRKAVIRSHIEEKEF